MTTHKIRRLALAVVPLALLAACEPFPEIGALPGATGEMPVILPMDEVLAQAPARRNTAAQGEALASRAEALKRRAKAMQGNVQDTQPKLRLPQSS